MRRHAGPLSARWNKRFPGFGPEALAESSERVGSWYCSMLLAGLMDRSARVLFARERQAALFTNAMPLLLD
jgi:hypothetical protein